MIECKQLTYSYRQVQHSPFDDLPAEKSPVVVSLRDLTFSIAPGTLTLVVGGSGSGKSTLLRTFNGLIPHFYSGDLEGVVRVSGEDVSTRELHDAGRTSAMIFQNPRTQFFTSYVDTELAFGLENYAVKPDVIRRRMEQAAATAGITHLMGRKLDTLSGGELQRVACACALVAGVDLLLFDEPTSNLSPDAIDDFAELVADLRRQGKTLVIAEHRLYPFADTADRVIRLVDGQIAEDIEGSAFFALSNVERRARGLRRLRRPDDPALAAAPSLGSATPGVRVENLTFAYSRGPQVLDIADLSIPAGKVTALTGVNGAGKTTLARVICGLEDSPRSARITFHGSEVAAAQRRRRCGMVMQDVRRQLFSASVEDEVRLGLDLSDEDVRDLLQRLDLESFVHRHPLSLSGGQAQRLVVAALVAANDEVVIFDEPTSGVDYEHLLLIANLLRELAHEGRTVVVITHDAELIDACADHVMTLHRSLPTTQ